MTDIIDICNLHFSFSVNPVFSNFSYLVQKGEIIAIVGNSGCGKSTLLNLISGTLMPNSGNIIVQGSISFLTQYLTLLPYRTAYENSLLACELRNTKTPQSGKKADELFDLFKLDELSKSKFPKELSGGMQQRIGLIQTLLTDADVYLLDEPFKEIDRTTGLIIQTYIWTKLRENLSTGLIVTHDIEQAVLISDRILFLSAEKPAEDIRFEKNFSELMPRERLKSDRYNDYMLCVIKKLSEI
jgi:ABC-type nitrate/sulfonate/bicarbonate transport system ATPase subunit